MAQQVRAGQERSAWSLSGTVMVVGQLLALALAVALVVGGATASSTVLVVAGVLLFLVDAIAVGGYVTVQPLQSRVVTLFGRYIGTIRQEGLRWVNPFTVRRSFSLRVRNLDSDTLKVNDAVGNPVEIAAVINWQVVDTFKAAFAVELYEGFVRIQTEAAVRHVASEFPYDDYEEGQASLRANADQVADTLKVELQGKLEAAGVAVLDCRLRRLAYAPEIAGEMLRRQQASAVVAARSRIVEGAVSMVEHALEMLSEREVVELDEERKAAMVSNLLVVLCSDRGAQPVVNAGTLYSG